MQSVAGSQLVRQMTAHASVLVEANVHFEESIFLGMAGERIMAFKVFAGAEFDKLSRPIGEAVGLDAQPDDILA